MTISKEEIKADFERFIRHEAMRANCTQSEIREIIESKQEEQKHVAKYKVGDTIYYSSFGRLVSFVIANIVEDGTDNPMYEDKDGNSVFEKDLVEQKPAAWSEYDEKFLLELSQCCDLNKTQVQWLISLKYRIQPQPKQEWGEEDEELLHDVSDTYFYNDEDYPEETYKLMLKRVLDWMTKRAKSLKPQPQWKPTKEQLIALQDARGIVGMYSIIGLILKEVIEELKKLREE
jgi:hypothetical protein